MSIIKTAVILPIELTLAAIAVLILVVSRINFLADLLDPIGHWTIIGVVSLHNYRITSDLPFEENK